jgi:N-hydroxyarylamine O-acetyltransferase
LPDAEALYALMQARFGLGVDDPKHGFSLEELTAIMAGFETHPRGNSRAGTAPPGQNEMA